MFSASDEVQLRIEIHISARPEDEELAVLMFLNSLKYTKYIHNALQAKHLNVGIKR